MDAPCPCGAASYKRLYKAEYARGDSGVYPFSLYACSRCHLVRTYPVPTVDLYTSGYTHSTSTSGDYVAQEKPGNIGVAEFVASWVTRRSQGRNKRVLDVGCNGGELVAALLQQGFEAEGCDVDPVAVKYGADRGLNLFCRDLTFDKLSGSYQAVTLIHTLEHIEQPGALLQNLTAALETGGLLHIRVPNFAGWIPLLMKQNWGFLMPPLHVWQFTPATLQELVTRETGLRLIDRRCDRHLEPKTTGAKGAMKSAVMACAVRFNRGDEIIATFQKA